jgi:CDP-diacylglycerol--glycerol-3-phosphate 3-phosphatidyltransferase
MGLSPGKVTVIGLLLSVATAYLLGVGQFVGGGLLLLLASALDMADGALARLQGRVTAAGALLDSSVDRVSEAVVFLGLLVFYIRPLSISEVLLIFLALIGSFMVSYLRARGEGLGVDCKVGVMTRPERVVVLAGGLLIGQMAVALGIIAAFSCLTALHRFWHINKELSKR